MAKRTPKSSRPAYAARTTTTTTTTTEEPPAESVAAALPVSDFPPVLGSLSEPADSGADSPPQEPASAGWSTDTEDAMDDEPASNIPEAPAPPETDPVQHVAEQLGRLLDALGSSASTAPWAPPISVYETPVELVVTIDVPGINRDALQVRTEHGLLVISGQRNPSPLGDAAIRHAESCFGPFRRVIPLPPGLRTSDVKAHVESGVVHVQIPRDSHGGGARRIDVA